MIQKNAQICLIFIFSPLLQIDERVSKIVCMLDLEHCHNIMIFLLELEGMLLSFSKPSVRCVCVCTAESQAPSFPGLHWPRKVPRMEPRASGRQLQENTLPSNLQPSVRTAPPPGRGVSRVGLLSQRVYLTNGKMNSRNKSGSRYLIIVDSF